MLAKSKSQMTLLSTTLFFTFVLGLAYIIRGPYAQPPEFSERANLIVGSVDRKEQKASAEATEAAGGKDATPSSAQAEPAAATNGALFQDTVAEMLSPINHEASNNNTKIKHHEVFSNMTVDGKRFMADFVDENSYNPSYLPHPYKPDTWIMIAQRDKQHDDNIIWNVELVCDAKFTNNKMTCTKSPMVLPIAATMSEYCDEEMSYFNDQIGPHDARIFYGPDAPYIVWTSQSHFNCLGQWIQDLRRVTDWDRGPTTNVSDRFFWPTNLQRPPPYGHIEKNWFLFWDNKGDVYMHFDITPRNRVFARLYDDGSVGEDLAPLVADQDRVCMEKYMPFIRPKPFPEWIHQSTNSLSVTMCRRSDPTCAATADNTFLLTLFQTKTFYFHGVYEPYLMLFKQDAPFGIYGITTVPIWYHGRGKPGGSWRDGTTKPKDQSEMIFTTSISFKEPGKKYHGYLDDTVLIGFGIEDQASGGIDVEVGELLRDLQLCDG